MKERPDLALLLTLLLAVAAYAPPAPAQSPQCRPIHVVTGEYHGPSRFDRGLLWKISRPGEEPSYLFGTIHVADDDITNVPDVVNRKLAGSRVFVMEALPGAEQAAQLSKMMFFNDHRRLDELISKPMFARVVDILSAYHVPKESAALLKPWAAFVTMSYPPDMRPILDLRLLQTAVDNGLDTRGLETLSEQGEIFDQMRMQDQVRLLIDAVCYHKRFVRDFDVMKSIYRKRDLKALYLYAQRYSFGDDSVYDALTRRMLTRRNHVMAERMQPVLEQGGAFIAIGAMHLPGGEGVLALLEKRKYHITRIY
jgi:uncharacterized protein YbaP (TraB family)